MPENKNDCMHKKESERIKWTYTRSLVTGENEPDIDHIYCQDCGEVLR